MTTVPQALMPAHFLQPPHRWVDVGDARLAYRRIGSGPDVFFVHGWPLSSATWRGVVGASSARPLYHFAPPGAA